MLLTPEQRATARSAICDYHNALLSNVTQPIREQLGVPRPPALLAHVSARVVTLSDVLHEPPADGPCELDESLLPALKRALISVRRTRAVQAEELRARTTDPELLDEIDRETRVLSELLHGAVLRDLAPLMEPRLSQFLKVAIVERRLGLTSGDGDRKLDEKFGLLLAPDTALGDVGTARTRCGLRGRSIVVAYIDIDDFGAFNREHTETKIDRLVLPQFMQVLEAHTFGRGAAYRFGGDEYLMLLVNTGGAEAVAALDALREDVASQTYPDVERRTTVSIGYCEVDAECALTDREIVDRANLAKNFAKEAGKNRVATYRTADLDEASLRVVAPRDDRTTAHPA